MIRVENLTFEYKNQDTDTGKITSNVVIDNLNLTIKKGEFVAVLGHNGSGKSTLAKHFNAILIPTLGTVYVKGIDTKNEDRLLEIRKTAGMVFQNPDNQMVAAIVEDDVAFAPENLGIPPLKIRERVDRALKDVKMEEYKKASATKLSGGQKQRVAIAGILAMEPECIILDEPTAMLDPEGRREVIQTIKELNKTRGITVVLITHYMEEACEADRVVVMDNGKILLDDVPKKVFREVRLLKSIGLSVPEVTELCYILRQNGINLPDDIITIDECIKELKKVIGEKSE